MTSLPNLILMFAVCGALFTWLTYRAGKTNNLLWSFLQHFTGVWFVFSGLVKAVDPIGTAYKMEDYFVAFQDTFAGLNNAFNGLAPLFPWLAKSSTGFSITMIILEIVLGIMLITGFARKLTAWLFFLIVFFFTILTGFTYLTGFVPTEANFFDFAKWGPYIKTQMRVTDCGCFGDFIKLDPRVSFNKDVFLMVPALMFLFRSSWMHQIFTKSIRQVVVGVSTLATTLFCFQNTYWNLPVVDFRPFAIGNNIRERKALEEEARGNIEIIGWVFEIPSTGEVVKEMEPEYKTAAAKYPKEQGWKVKEQVKTEPFVEKDGKRVVITESKVSDFAVEDAENGEVTEDLLNEKGYSLMIVAYKLYGEMETSTVSYIDSVYTNDTLRINADSMVIIRRATGTETKTKEVTVFNPEDGYADLFLNQVNPLAEAATKAGWKVYAITTYGDADAAVSFKKVINASYPFYRADDKLLKTIIRANPGVVILKDGQVLDMYHHRHLPTFEEISK